MDCLDRMALVNHTTLKNADRYDETNCRKDLLCGKLWIGKI